MADTSAMKVGRMLLVRCLSAIFISIEFSILRAEPILLSYAPSMSDEQGALKIQKVHDL